MADIEPPSFSLGLDLDSSISHPHNANPNPDPDPLTHPSFSLGLDFQTQSCGPQNNSTPFGNEEKEGDKNGLEFRVSDSEPDDEPRPVLRRLRRGGPDRKTEERLSSSVYFVDDDIEEFSSQECDPIAAPRNNTLCSSSKVSLSGCGILKSQRGSEVQNKKRKQDSSCRSTITSVDVTRGKSVLSHLAASPLRKFQLVDSDSDLDDPSESVHSGKDASVVGCSKQEKRKGSIQDYYQFPAKKKTKSLTPVSEKQDLWKNFYEDKTRAVPTPVFDDLCNEYFSALKKKGVSSSVTEYCSNELGKNANFTNKMKHTSLEFSSPPSHRYFFHDDLRIQNLVHSRLPYFCPLVAPGDTRSKPSNQSGIDYMSQFGHGDAAKQQTGRQSNAGNSSQRSQLSHGNTARKRTTAKQSNAGKSSRRSGKKVNTSGGEGTSHAPGDWVNPKQIANIPKDAGKRRVHADGQSAGHWFTDENGKKVYVTSNGKELRGRQAYTHYKKESGKGAKKKTSKKK